MSFSFKPTQPQASTPAGNPSAGASAPAPAAPVKLANVPTPDFTESGKLSLTKIVLGGLFGVLLILTIALFVYHRYLNQRIEAQKKVLADSDKELGKLNIEQMRALSNRMRVINQTLAEHASVSTAFNILEESVERSVTYTRFSLVRKEGAKSGYDLQLDATAPSYKAVAQQIDTLKGEVYSKEFIPSLTYDGLALDDSGHVSFSLKMPILIQGKLPESVLLKTRAAEAQAKAGTSTSSTASSTTQ